MDQSTEKSDLKSSSSNALIKKTKSSGKPTENAVNRASAAYQKMQETSPYNQSVENLYLRRAKRVIKAHKRTVTHPLPKTVTEEDNEAIWNDGTRVENITNKQKNPHTRSHSQPNSHPARKLKYDDPLFNKVRNAKKLAETAIKVCEILVQRLIPVRAGVNFTEVSISEVSVMERCLSWTGLHVRECPS